VFGEGREIKSVAMRVAEQGVSAFHLTTYFKCYSMYFIIDLIQSAIVALQTGL
jgi:hypothetical protein